MKKLIIMSAVLGMITITTSCKKDEHQTINSLNSSNQKQSALRESFIENCTLKNGRIVFNKMDTYFNLNE